MILLALFFILSIGASADELVPPATIPEDALIPNAGHFKDNSDQSVGGYDNLELFNGAEERYKAKEREKHQNQLNSLNFQLNDTSPEEIEVRLKDSVMNSADKAGIFNLQDNPWSKKSGGTSDQNKSIPTWAVIILFAACAGCGFLWARSLIKKRGKRENLVS